MIYELFSSRKDKLTKSGGADVYQYDRVPDKLRVQIQQILVDAIGPQYKPDPYALSAARDNRSAWDFIRKTLCRELGVHRLSGDRLDIDQVMNFITSASTDQFLDVVELCGRVIERMLCNYNRFQREEVGIKQESKDAIEEINFRFRESGFGYRFESGQILRVDGEFTHEEIVKPALRLLDDKRFEGVQQEFLAAHRLYRTGEYGQSIVEAAKALESMLKAVCDLKDWPYSKGARATDLLKVVRAQGLWPDYLDGSFDQLIATLNSGLPKIRNEEGAHGQGASVKQTPSYIAAYALNLSAAKICLIGKAAS